MKTFISATIVSVCLLFVPAFVIGAEANSICHGDFDYDSDVDALDLTEVIAHYPFDINFDNAIDSQDIEAFVNNFGNTNCLPAPPSRGNYLFTRQPVANLKESMVVEFHPYASYAIVLEQSNIIHIYQWESQTTTSFDLSSLGENVIFQDAVFEPNGLSAFIVGWTSTTSGEQNGVIYQFDDAAWRQFLAGDNSVTVIDQITSATGDHPYKAIAYPWNSDGFPVILESWIAGSGGGIAYLKELNTDTGTFEGLSTATTATAVCTDMAFVKDAFGTEGILVVCGINGADARYYSYTLNSWNSAGYPPIGGNPSHAAAQPGGDYALVIDFSGRRLRPFSG